eukprot:23834_1
MTTKKKQQDVGIVSIQSYFPKSYVSQSELETFQGKPKGKYTIGLGQNAMGFVTDAEDICSISLTVLSQLIKNNNVTFKDIGWICVATETIIDASKSVLSAIMQLFANKNNHNIEAVDVRHAFYGPYGGTHALFSAFERITSDEWDGKYCIVIAADIVEHSNVSTLCTGGVGAIALLFGYNGCIKLNPLRSTYVSHEYDFYVPHL